MRILNDEKDIFIKDKLQEDKLISKKADDIFNKISKGEFFMEEKFENPNLTKEKIVNLKPKAPKWKKILATAACLVLVIGVANVYATSQGYDNVFFLIKYLVTGEGNVDGKENILSDRDITISYEPINISQGLNVIIKKLQIKNNEAKLYVITTETEKQNTNITPLKFIAYNAQNEKLCEQTSIEDVKLNKSVTDELILKGFKETDKIINLEIYNVNSEKITTLVINIEERTVEVQGEKEALQKISEIELKEFLGYAAGLSRDLQISEEDKKIDIACNMIKNKNLSLEEDKDGAYLFSIDEVNNMLESFIGEKVETLKNETYFKVVTKNGKKYYKYIYIGHEEFVAECINISNISYCNGLYTVNYSYYYRGVEGDEDIDMDRYDVYEQEICISLNDSNKYSKFKVESMKEPTVIKKANNTENEETTIENNTNNNNQTTDTANTNNSSNNNNSTNNSSNNNNSNSNTSNEKIDNYASTMEWKEYFAPSIRFQYPKIFNLEEVGGENRGTYKNDGQVSTKITGIAVGIDPDTKERVDSNMEIRIYEPSYIDGDISKYKYYDNGVERQTTTTGSGLVWYESKAGEVGKDYIETYTHIEYFHDGTWAIFKIEFETKGEFNYKARNITTWLLNSTKITNF